MLLFLFLIYLPLYIIYIYFLVYVDNGFGVEAQRREPLAEDVVNFLGCAASNGAAGSLLR